MKPEEIDFTNSLIDVAMIPKHPQKLVDVTRQLDNYEICLLLGNLFNNVPYESDSMGTLTLHSWVKKE